MIGYLHHIQAYFKAPYTNILPSLQNINTLIYIFLKDSLLTQRGSFFIA